MDLFGNLKRMPLSPHLSVMFPACSATAYQHPWQVVTTRPLPYITKASSCCRQHVVPSGGFFTYTWDVGTTEIHGNATRRIRRKRPRAPPPRLLWLHYWPTLPPQIFAHRTENQIMQHPAIVEQPKCDACCPKKNLKTRTPSTKINGRKKQYINIIYIYMYNH